jgi:hypothetical protein
VDELLEKGDSLVRRNEEIGNIIYHGMNVSIYTEILQDVLHGNVPPEYSNNRFALFKDVSETFDYVIIIILSSEYCWSHLKPLQSMQGAIILFQCRDS